MHSKDSMVVHNSGSPDAMLDWVEWHFFLVMLSVERLEPFLSELELPFERSDFPRIMHLARACLEVDMLPTIGEAVEKPEGLNLRVAWQTYRMSREALSDGALKHFLERYGNSDNAAHKTYLDLAGEWIGASVSSALTKWFVENYRSAPDPAQQWPWALRILFTDHPIKINTTSHAPLTEMKRQRIERFCTTYYKEKDALERRFYINHQIAKLSRPTLWEAVLQTSPTGEIDNNFSWIDSIEQCLQLKLLRKEWSKLTNF